MRYRYIIEKTQEYKITSPDFPSILAESETEDSAFSKFLTLVFTHIRDCLKNNDPVPDPPSLDKAHTFGLPLNMALKLRLHNICLIKDVSKAELARFLALTYNEVGENDWNIKSLRNLPALKAPKYKKVQRLFSIDHESTIREVEQAYRVLGYTVDVMPIERNMRRN